jgi:hypothetical protein
MPTMRIPFSTSWRPTTASSHVCSACMLAASKLGRQFIPTVSIPIAATQPVGAIAAIRIFCVRDTVSAALRRPLALTESAGSNHMCTMLRTPSESVHGLLSYSEGVPSLDKLVRDGRASSKRIHANETVIRRTSKATLIEWLDQAKRLWTAAEIHGLEGRRFTVFAEQIGIDRSREGASRIVEPGNIHLLNSTVAAETPTRR